MKVICIGSSAASLSCATQLRRLDKDIQVTMLTAQSHKANNTCLLTDYFASKRTKESLYLPIPAGVEIHYNSNVMLVNPEDKKVVTGSGQEYFYDKLFIGTGLKPVIPEIFQDQLYTKVFPFKTLDDIVQFEKQNIPGKRVLVVGGGVTGVEACYALYLRGYRVTLAEKNGRLLPLFNKEIAQEIYELFIANGVSIWLNYAVTADVVNHFNAIFLAPGGLPATEFLQDQLVLEHGFIVVDSQQKTSLKDIYAGGDVCVGRTLWPQAVRDGTVAAYGILDSPSPQFKSIKYKTVASVFDATFFLF